MATIDTAGDTAGDSAPFDATVDDVPDDDRPRRGGGGGGGWNAEERPLIHAIARDRRTAAAVLPVSLHAQRHAGVTTSPYRQEGAFRRKIARSWRQPFHL